jgi:hypothetical protein
MTDERQKPDLSSIEPIAPAPGVDEDATDAPIDNVDRIGRGVAEVVGSTPAVGVTAETVADDHTGDEAGARGPDR